MPEILAGATEKPDGKHAQRGCSIRRAGAAFLFLLQPYLLRLFLVLLLWQFTAAVLTTLGVD
jgi:hypothetical protein